MKMNPDEYRNKVMVSSGHGDRSILVKEDDSGKILIGMTENDYIKWETAIEKKQVVFLAKVLNFFAEETKEKVTIGRKTFEPLEKED
ncbi:MAG: hypothetical protein CI952_83 [Methanohalophilus sp.]|jgi:hypothetical protein|nr:MAG: hypothetical protein CI952_83 [Methanohalophilus sp.]